MNFDGNFRSLGTVDVLALKARVLAQTEEQWNADPYRQRSFAIHRMTHTIPLVFDRDFRHEQPTRCARFAELEEVVTPILDAIERHFDGRGWLVRCLLVRLAAGGVIEPHIDAGDSLSRVHRIHVPIVTNDRVFFVVGEEVRRMREGEIWEINNKRRHSVQNLGPTGRVNLVCDWAPAEPAARSATAERVDAA